MDVETHPVQTHHIRLHTQTRVPKVVTMRAYEVYCDVCSPQEALIDDEGRGCRGGFGIGELIAFLYARSFPKKEWDARFNEAQRGMENIA